MAAAAAGDHADRLSALPDNVLHHILSFFDTLSIVETSILSNRWKSLWKDVPVLNIHRKHHHHHHHNNSSNSSFQEKIHNLLSLRSHHAAVTELNFDCFCPGEPTLSSEQYQLFDSVIKHASHAADSLRKLKLTRLHLISSTTPRFNSLTTLELHHCPLGLDSFADHFPCLKRLKLLGLTSGNLKVSGVAQLEHLEIQEAYGIFIRSMEVSAPKLKSFSCHRAWTEEEADPDRACLKLLGGLHNAESLVLCFVYRFEGEQSEDSSLAVLKSSLLEHEASPFTRLKSLRVQYRRGSPPDIPYHTIRYFFNGPLDSTNRSLAIEKID